MCYKIHGPKWDIEVIQWRFRIMVREEVLRICLSLRVSKYCLFMSFILPGVSFLANWIALIIRKRLHTVILHVLLASADLSCHVFSSGYVITHDTTSSIMPLWTPASCDSRFNWASLMVATNAVLFSLIVYAVTVVPFPLFGPLTNAILIHRMWGKCEREFFCSC